MKAVQVRKAYDLVTAEVKKPVLSKDDEVLVKVKRVGVCGSDMHIYHGTNPLPPESHRTRGNGTSGGSWCECTEPKTR